MHRYASLIARVRSSSILQGLLFLALAAVYVAAFRPLTHFSDTAFFGNDVWEYQSMGVNFAHGHGLNKWGGIEPIGAYAFEKPPSDESAAEKKQRETMERDFAKSGNRGAGTDDFIRMPLYTVFLGGIYSAVGVHPFAVRIAQLAILAMVAAGLPWLGALLWGSGGAIAGAAAGIPFLYTNILFADQLLVETLAIGLLFLLLLAAARYERRPTTGRAIIVGIAAALGILAKITLILTLPFFIVFLLVRRRGAAVKHCALMLCACVAVVAPWSIYASVESGGFLPLTSQGTKDAMLDVHNEYAASDGYLHPEWRTASGSFFNADHLQNQPAALRIVNFYTHRPEIFAKNMIVHLAKNAAPIRAIVLIVLLLALEGLVGPRLLRRIPPLRIALLLVVVLYWANLAWNDNTVPTTDIMQALRDGKLNLMIVELCAVLLLLVRRALANPILTFPASCLAVGANMLFLSLIFMADDAVYESRYVKAADFLFVLIAIRLTLAWIRPPSRTHA